MYQKVNGFNLFINFSTNQGVIKRRNLVGKNADKTCSNQNRDSTQDCTVHEAKQISKNA